MLFQAFNNKFFLKTSFCDTLIQHRYGYEIGLKSGKMIGQGFLSSKLSKKLVNLSGFSGIEAKKAALFNFLWV
jgi:hypothetical protein